MTTIEPGQTLIAYSEDEENFYNFEPTLKDALQSALCDFPDAAKIYIADADKKSISYYVNRHTVESLLDDMNENAAEHCGEVFVDWLQNQYIDSHMTEETKDEIHRQNTARLDSLLNGLKQLLDYWANERKEQPDFWHLDNVRSYSRDAAADKIGEETIKATATEPGGVNQC